MDTRHQYDNQYSDDDKIQIHSPEDQVSDGLAVHRDPYTRSNNEQTLHRDPYTRSNNEQTLHRDPYTRSNNDQTLHRDPYTRSNNDQTLHRDPYTRSNNDQTLHRDPYTRSNNEPTLFVNVGFPQHTSAMNYSVSNNVIATQPGHSIGPVYNPADIPDYTCFSVIVILFFCPCVGICALINARDAHTELVHGRKEEALKTARAARNLSIAGVIICAVFTAACFLINEFAIPGRK